MDLEDLKNFEHLARTLHFGQTARARGMSPSALSRCIQAIEGEVGQVLVLRDRRNVRLSPAGQVFRRYAKRQLEQYEELLANLRVEEQTPSGELDVACTVTACHTILPTLLSQFRKRYPGITLRLLTQDAARSRAQLEAGDLDLAVVPTDDESDERLAVTVLASTELVFIAPRDPSLLGDGVPRDPSRFRASDLGRVPLVVPIGGLERERLDRWLERRNLTPRIVAEVRGNEGIIAMVSLGSGVGLVPELVLSNSPLIEGIRALEGVAAPTGYRVSLCARPNSLKRRVVEAFWNLAREEVSARSVRELGA